MLLRDRARQQLPGPLADITAEHRFSVRVLALLELEAQALTSGLRPDLRLVREGLHFFVHVLDEVHHPREELILERMRSRADAQTLLIIERLHADHHALRDAGHALQEAFSGRMWVSRRARRLHGHRLAQYCGGLRRHMRTEETQVYEPALKLLQARDWREIADTLAGLPNEICGIDALPEYRWLLNRYLNQVAVVSSAGLPYAWLDRMASVVERCAHTGLQLTRLPSRLTGVLRSTVQAVRNPPAPFEGAGRRRARVKSAIQTGLHGGLEAGEIVRDSFRRPVSDDASNVREPALLTEHELMTFGEKPRHHRGGFAVSWQASGTSLLLRAAVKPMLRHYPLGAARWMRRLPQLSNHRPGGFSVESLTAEGVCARLFKPRKSAAPPHAILYLPGGAFVFPASNGHVRALARLARNIDAIGLMVDYRLVPEHGFPAQLEDALAAYRYLLDIGYQPQSIVVAGDSAGGGLTLSLLQALREEQLPLPACAACLSPFADLSFSAPSFRFNHWYDAVLSSTVAADALQLYIGEHAPDDPLVSPVNGRYHGMPPLLFQVSSNEVLLDDSLRVARKARAQGVEVELEVWPSLPHAWQVFAHLPEARSALTHVGRFFRQHLERRARLRPSA